MAPRLGGADRPSGGEPGRAGEFPPPINGSELRQDAILAELRAIRGALERHFLPAASAVPADGDAIELREPARPRRGRR